MRISIVGKRHVSRLHSKYRQAPRYVVIMKRSASSVSKATSKAKRRRPEVPEYHLTPSLRDKSGEIIWPAPNEQIESARKFIQEW
jgi:hypothetical protein